MSRLALGAMTFGQYSFAAFHASVDQATADTMVGNAWLLAKPEVSSVIVGASRPEQLAENLAAASFSLTEAEVAELDALDPPAPIYPGPGWMTPAE